MLIRLALLGAAGYLGYRQLAKRKAAPAYDEREAADGVRNAGASATRDGSEEDWDRTDLAMDQTFPASDPPANY